MDSSLPAGPNRPENYVGQHLHQLTILSVTLKKYPSRTIKFFTCQCICGTVFERAASKVTNNTTYSCGCIPSPLPRRERTPRKQLHDVWWGMIQRCTDPKHKSYHKYGARGILPCAAWKIFDGFYRDMQAGYAPGLVLDRRDATGPYSPDNCQWISSLSNAWRRTPRGANHSSKYTGVIKMDGKTPKWRAAIQAIKETKIINLGTYSNEKQAALAYDAKCLELRGPEAALNQVFFRDDFTDLQSA